ncbi:hypothetical protein GRI72_09330 [Altererythrobacter marinus]|uniref:Cyclic GMP-AMP synthase n=1 Tax=Pelagerythrobacter marinus TaxID=538382 RepID=A0ABW9UWP2_9SPHN|nr:hypothetical protein [Pelagerythrobacter marinus]MXO69025.1 hypothetical protein [Pelagerythrobacter marinus]
MTLANAHALFNGLRTSPSYLANLEISKQDRVALMEARRLIRATLKEAASAIKTESAYWQDSYVRKVSWRDRPVVTVKFMTQGSFAYQTLNNPAQVPVQQIDLDDGMYVPVTFLDNGEPALAALGLFNFVEAALAPLCEEKGWELNPGEPKSSCVRIEINSRAHIDIPIYSIPDEQFEELREAMAKSIDAGILDRAHATYMARIPSDKVMLAKRNGQWEQSDPQKLHDWVEGRSERYGAVYRRLCRFFKGWRDYTWEESKLSSICIMHAVDLALQDENGRPPDNRDDELILKVARKLPDIFRGRVCNPVIEEACLNEWDADTRSDIVGHAQDLADEMATALERTGDAERVVQKLRNRFGERIPYRPDAVRMSSTEIESIRKATPAKVAAPLIVPSTSG